MIERNVFDDLAKKMQTGLTAKKSKKINKYYGTFSVDNGYFIFMDRAIGDLEQFLLVLRNGKIMRFKIFCKYDWYLFCKHYLQIIYDSYKHLKCIHRCKYVHNDPKPGNILAFDDKNNKNLFGTLVDYGLAKKVGKKRGQKKWGGSPLWSPPEKLLHSDYDFPYKIDIYSMANLFLECLLGENIFGELDDLEDLIEHLEDTVDGEIRRVSKKLDSLKGMIPNDVIDIIRNSLLKQPRLRPSINDILHVLKRHLPKKNNVQGDKYIVKYFPKGSGKKYYFEVISNIKASENIVMQGFQYKR